MRWIVRTVMATALTAALSGCFTDVLTLKRTVVLDGSSTAAAIPVSGVDAEYAWLAANRPGWRPVQQTLVLGGPGEAYDLFVIAKGTQSEKVFFDISSFYGKPAA